MLSFDPSGHAAYQDHVLVNFCKYYPDPSSRPKSTWDILKRFFVLNLDNSDILLKDRYSAFKPKLRLPSCTLRSYLLSSKFNITSVTG